MVFIPLVSLSFVWPQAGLRRQSRGSANLMSRLVPVTSAAKRGSV